MIVDETIVNELTFDELTFDKMTRSQLFCLFAMPGFASTKISNKTKRRRLIVQQSQSDAFFAIIALFRVTSLPLLTFVTFFWPKNAEKNFFNLTFQNKKFISVRKAALFQIST